MIKFSCKKCGRKLNVEDKHSGKRVRCPKCGDVSVVPDNSDKIKFHCESCGQSIHVPQVYAGKKGKCPKCRNPIVVPSLQKPPSEAAETFTIVCSMCDETVQVPATSRGQAVECPECGSYIETSSGDALSGSDAPVPPRSDEDPYQEETEEYEESAGTDRRIIVGISAVAAVVVVGLIILVAVLRSSGSRPGERPEGLRAQQQDADTDSRPQPVTSDTQAEKPVEAVSPPKPGDVVANSIGMKLVYIPPGSFMMGSSDKSAAQLAKKYGTGVWAFAREFPQHQVRISKGFWIGQTEVTQGQYKSVMNAQPWSGEDYVQEDVNNPAVLMSWKDAMEFCRKLSQQEGKTYRLPTEAEWEYACRAGTTTRFSFGDSDSSIGDYAWYASNTRSVGQGYAHSVAQKKPNPWGMYDMHGNVCEWCSDWYDGDYYSNSPSVDPEGPPSGEFRSLRGGSWGLTSGFLRCSHRDRHLTDVIDDTVGFRVLAHAAVALPETDGPDLPKPQLRDVAQRPKQQLLLIRTKTRLEKPKSCSTGDRFAFSPDGKTVARGSAVRASFGSKLQEGCDVTVWNARSAKLIKSLGRHDHFVSWVAFSQDGRTLVSASRDDGTIKVWQMPDGRLRHTLKIDAAAPATNWRWPELALSGDGRTLVTISARVISVAGGGRMTTSGELIVWDLDSGQKRWSKADSNVYTAALTADGRGMVSVLREITDLRSDGPNGVQYRPKYALQSWNVETGDALESVDLANVGTPDAVVLLDGDKTMALFTSRGLSLRDRLTGDVKHEIKWHKDRSFGRSFLSADGKTVGRSGFGWLELVDIATGQSRGLLTTESPKRYMYFSADLKRAADPYDRGASGTGPVILDLVHAAVPLPKTDGPDLPKPQQRDVAQLPRQQSQRRDVAQWPKHLATLSGHDGTVTSAAFSPDGELLATGGTGRGSGQLKLWDLSTGKPIWQKDVHTSHVRGVAYSPDGHTVATASYDGTIGLWDAAGGEQLDTLTGHENWVNAVAFSPDGRYLISGGRDTNACLWQIHPQGSPRAQLVTTLRGHEMWVMAVAFSADGTRWASASADPTNGAKPGRVIVSNTPGQMKHESQIELTTGGFALALSSDSKTIAVGGNGEITIYDASTNKVVRTWKAHDGKVNAVAFSPDDKLLASGGSDKSVKLWNTEAGKLVNMIDAHRSQVYAVTFSPDGKRLLTTSRDKTARLWNVE
ncbi:MAG: SUMF1/EgtB/PvdO family nonheme iron enzyme [Planctomycetota bacterium]